MKTKIELDENFSLPDGERNHLKEIGLLATFSLFFVILIFVAVCNADEIDKFFTWVVSNLFYGTGKERFGAICFVVGCLSFLFSINLTIRKLRL